MGDTFYPGVSNLNRQIERMDTATQILSVIITYIKKKGTDKYAGIFEGFLIQHKTDQDYKVWEHFL